MFVTVLFGESRMEMFNINCKLIHFVQNLKERCGVDLKDCVDLMNRNGTVVNLETNQLGVDMASSLLAERQHYVLLQVCRNDNNEGLKYISLLQNVSQSHPEFTEPLRKVCNPGEERDKKVNSVRRSRTRTKTAAGKSSDKNDCQQ
ncbi:uncharacterized protein C22orf15 [Corythoichthys intestinalis]|uniref:uncharacterized protein C22orf15 n=1 Tax=Corythoichthys intestinalis TaxID=161448 RepID=UPI0025A66017|nr:uncharacterized protein C22orf15 [Corythoichthys intestinalis]XP_057687772.1 uncharacterized protein C22orf15 [Corythoichthys intestinalis]